MVFLRYYFLKKHEVNSEHHIPSLEPCFDRSATDPLHVKKMLVCLLKSYFNKPFNCSIKLGGGKKGKANKVHFCPVFKREIHPARPALIQATRQLGSSVNYHFSSRAEKKTPFPSCISRPSPAKAGPGQIALGRESPSGWSPHAVSPRGAEATKGPQFLLVPHLQPNMAQDWEGGREGRVFFKQ